MTLLVVMPAVTGQKVILDRPALGLLERAAPEQQGRAMPCRAK